MREFFSGMGELYHVDVVADFIATLRFGELWKNGFDGEFDVLIYGEPRKEGVVLEHQAEVGAGLFDDLTIHGDFSCGGLLEAGEQGDEGGFTRAGESDDGDEFIFFNREVDVGENVGSVGDWAEGDVDVFDV